MGMSDRGSQRREDGSGRVSYRGLRLVWKTSSVWVIEVRGYHCSHFVTADLRVTGIKYPFETWKTKCQNMK